jgi:hypothetical protein
VGSVIHGIDADGKKPNGFLILIVNLDPDGLDVVTVKVDTEYLSRLFGTGNGGCHFYMVYRFGLRAFHEDRFVGWTRLMPGASCNRHD